MPRYEGRDITTISAVLSNQALLRHVELCEEAASVPPRMPAPPKASEAQPRNA